MTVFDAILLGLLQGLTEFIPISSTAHLTLAGRLLGIVGMETTAAWTEFIAIVQIGTLLSVIVYFTSDLQRITRSVLADASARTPGRGWARFSLDSRVAFSIAAGTVPVVVLGLLLDSWIHSWFTKNMLVIAASLIVLAAFLWIAERVARHVRDMDDLRPRDAIIIGFAQALALIPGSSRSGTTITAGLFLNFRRETAARFSFLLSIPAIAASGLYELVRIHGEVGRLGYGNLIVATIVAAVSGYVSIAWLLKYLTRNSTMLFVWYRIALGCLLIVMLLLGVVEP